MSDADIREANISQANVAGTSVYGLQYGPCMTMSGHYFGLRGVESCYGNALFARDAQDQDYLDSMKRSIDETPSPALYALVIATFFGLLYMFDRVYEWGMIDYSGSADSPLRPFYYSTVTYTTLGFGDITPQNWVGEVVVVAEVIMGYTALGLLLSILANRVARQS